METTNDERVVLISVDTLQTATTIARELVGTGMAACCTVLPGVHSVYTWNGAVEEADEVLMLIKTVQAHLEACERAVRAMHPYDTMEMIAWTVSDIHEPYRRWMRSVLH